MLRELKPGKGGEENWHRSSPCAVLHTPLQSWTNKGFATTQILERCWPSRQPLPWPGFFRRCRSFSGNPGSLIKSWESIDVQGRVGSKGLQLGGRRSDGGLSGETHEAVVEFEMRGFGAADGRGKPIHPINISAARTVHHSNLPLNRSAYAVSSYSRML